MPKRDDIESIVRELQALVRRKDSGNPIPSEKIEQLERKLERARSHASHAPRVVPPANPTVEAEGRPNSAILAARPEPISAVVDVPEPPLAISEPKPDDSGTFASPKDDVIASPSVHSPDSDIIKDLSRKSVAQDISRELDAGESSHEDFLAKGVFLSDSLVPAPASSKPVKEIIERALTPSLACSSRATLLDYVVFKNTVERISGSETEAREMSLCFLIVTTDTLEAAGEPDPRYLDLVDGCPQMGVGAIDFSSLDFAAIRQQLIELGPFAPGGFNQPAIMLKIWNENGRPSAVQESLGIRIPISKLTSVWDSHGYLRAITRTEVFPDARDIYVVWMRPARAIRIYRNGELVLQSIQLRKTQIRSYRVPSALIKDMGTELKRRGIVNEQGNAASSSARALKQLLELLTTLALEFSENRTGSALYIVSSGLLDQIEQKRFSELSITSMKRMGNNVAITSMPFGTLTHLCREDGATVIDETGMLLATQVYFGGSGGRKSTARYVCCEQGGGDFPACAIVISQDGDILYTGRSKLVPWGEIDEIEGTE